MASLEQVIDQQRSSLRLKENEVFVYDRAISMILHNFQHLFRDISPDNQSISSVLTIQTSNEPALLAESSELDETEKNLMTG